MESCAAPMERLGRRIGRGAVDGPEDMDMERQLDAEAKRKSCMKVSVVSADLYL